MIPAVTIPDALRVPLCSMRTYAAKIRDRIVPNPIAVTVVVVSLFIAYAAYRLFEPLPPGTWPVLKDSVVFEYSGWYLAQGNRLYIDFWEIKPPLVHWVTAVLALVTGGDVVLYHVLNLLANCGAIVLGAAAASGIVHELTDDFSGALVAGVATFTLPFYFYRALIGFKAKYFIVAAGLGCLYLAYRDRYVAAGVTGAAAVGVWQLAVVFPIGALGLSWQADSREGATKFLVAGAGTGLIVLLPVVLWGAVPAMVAEVLLTPLLTTEQHIFTERVQYLIRTLGKTLPIVLIGLAGIAQGLVPRRFQREWPLVLAMAWFTVLLITLDFDYLPDLFPWFAVVCVGVGLAAASQRRSDRIEPDDHRSGTPSQTGSRALAVAVLAMATLSVVTMGGYGTGTTGFTNPDTYDINTQLDPDFAGARTYNASESQYVFWNRVEIPTCRAFGGRTQQRLVNQLELAEDKPWYEAPCGQFDPVWRAVRRKYGL